MNKTIAPAWQALAALATMWMTNLYNFMDGSDGLAGGMALFGLTGFVIGPAIAALFIASWDLFAPPGSPAYPPDSKR